MKTVRTCVSGGQSGCLMVLLVVCAVVFVRCGGGVWCELMFFFFQAEDGIRDLIVTGVQTCALPI